MWQGVKYERKAQAFLVRKYPTYVPNLWLQFREAGYSTLRWCQPDGVHFDFINGIITIVEIKYCHTADAYFQLQELYLPVISTIFGSELWEYRLSEWVLWYDPATTFPGKHYLRPKIEDIKPTEIGVTIWKPNKNR